MHDVFIGLGSNLSNPVQQLQNALQSLNSLRSSCLIKQSQFYKSKAWGPVQDQPNFVNAVALLQTELGPLELLTELKAIEQRQGRVLEVERWGPRCIDLDILLYGQESWQSHELTIPHSQLGERAFVIYPLLELAPNLVLPNGVKLRDLAKDLASLELLNEA